ncbi:type II secretion system F family protein [Candidatus Xianfuyuplasma coldseepsis]|uniref:Type II secretion system F family protein n=1 Tax=Candidatus Xianfuyuplasma coldseepsis TaxID=2782163 RepID=A0A7L7KVZ7_9MOLU|nr:type II secretion system F family protein [Xianfuyuplasma coldseepsis]QMS85928.1 type II secretion system F family protein [Xianfuyuplasma coldseepsis]
MQIFDYRYRARRLRDGKVVKGITEAPNKAMVSKFLQEQGLKPIEIYTKKSIMGQMSRISFGKVLKERDLIFYLRQLHSLLKAGVKLNEASEILATQQTNKLIRRIFYGIYFEVNSGTSLADAYKEYPADFPDILVSMIRVGEQTGNLKSALEDVVRYFETQYRIKNSIRQTMMMPIIYLVIAFAVGIFIFTVVMPQFESMFATLGGDMPAVTALFIKVGNFLEKNGILLVLGMILFVIAFIVLKKRSTKFQRFLSYMSIKFPILGSVTKLNNLSRIAATLSQLLNSKVPLQECLATTYEVVSNRIYRDLIIQAQKNVNEGEYMSQAFENHYAVEVVFTRMISVGEQTGDLGRMLASLSTFYDEDSVVKIDRVRKLLEPVMMLVIFSLVVVMLLAIMLPSLSYSTAM